MKMTTAERNELNRQLRTGTEYDHNFPMGWDEEKALEHMRSHCTVTEEYGTIAYNDGTINHTTILQFHNRQDLIDFYECEMKLKKEINADYEIWAHIDKMIIFIRQSVNFIDNVDAIKAYYNESEEDGMWAQSSDGPVFVPNEEE